MQRKEVTRCSIPHNERRLRNIALFLRLLPILRPPVSFDRWLLVLLHANLATTLNDVSAGKAVLFRATRVGLFSPRDHRGLAARERKPADSCYWKYLA